MKFIRDRIFAWARGRQPDFIIGGAERPYLRRHWLIPRNRFFNVYVHEFLRSDDDRAEHTHPWINCSFLLEGSYVEWQHGVPTPRHAGDVVFRRSGHIQHRVELTDGPCWTIFVTGPVYKDWHFVCPQGLVFWRDFVDARDSGSVGKGCDQ